MFFFDNKETVTTCSTQEDDDDVRRASSSSLLLPSNYVGDNMVCFCKLFYSSVVVRCCKYPGLGGREGTMMRVKEISLDRRPPVVRS